MSWKSSNSMLRRFRLLMALLLLTAGLAAPSYARGRDCERKQDDAATTMKPPAAMPEMDNKMPMQTEMAKPGAMAMDVSQRAAAKDDCMRPMLNKEENTIDAGKTGTH